MLSRCYAAHGRCGSASAKVCAAESLTAQERDRLVAYLRLLDAHAGVQTDAKSQHQLSRAKK